MLNFHKFSRTAVAKVDTEGSPDKRLALLNAFMSCPHRDTDKIKAVHEDVRKQDPIFYGHLACWYDRTGDVRDNKEVFAALLSTDPFQ
jgi:hypothetical protein